MDRRLASTATIPGRIVAAPPARSVLAPFLLVLASWAFGLPGAVLLAGLLVFAPALASAWAWMFVGFWLLFAAADRALGLAVGPDE